MNEAELDDLLSTPRRETVAALAACPGDIIILGAGGKMGPTLARMAARAAGSGSRVIAVSRWSSDSARSVHAISAPHTAMFNAEEPAMPAPNGESDWVRSSSPWTRK